MSNLSFDNAILPPSFISLYYYYTSLTMALSWLIAPFLFYAILTQSNTLGIFKWLIFYYSFLNLFFTTYIGIFKPVFFPPAFAGIQLGILRNSGNFFTTLIMTLFSVFLCCISILGFGLTTKYRYLMIFPSPLKQWLTKKKATIFIFSTSASSCILVLAFIINAHQIPIEVAIEWGKQYDNNLILYIKEKSFFIVPYDPVETVLKIAAGIAYFACFFQIFVGTLFFYQMKKFKAALKTNVNYYLSLSAIIQGFVLIIFLLLPYTFLVTSFAFQIPNTSSYALFASGFLSTHCFVDFVTTIIFIKPYRKFWLKLFRKDLTKIAVITPASIIHRN